MENLLVKKVVAIEAESGGFNGASSADINSVKIDDNFTVSRAEGVASTVGRALSMEELVRGTVGGLRGIDGKAFLAAEVLASGVLT